MRAINTTFVLCCLCLIVTGCWDMNELEERAIVVGIGLDYMPQEDRVLVSFQIANPQVGVPNTGGENEVPQEIITFTTPDFLTARDLANASVARKLSFAHNKVIIIGEELARSEKLLHVLEASLRDREIRRETKFLVTKEPASNFLKSNKPKLETRPHKFYDLMFRRWEETGLVPYSTLERYFQNTEADTSAFLAAYATAEKSEPEYGNEDEYLPGQIDIEGANPTQMIGAAVFKDGQMIGTLNGEENRIALALRPSSRAVIFLTTYLDPLNSDYRISARMHTRTEPKFHFDLQADPVRIDVTVPIEMGILSIPSTINYVTDKHKQDLLEISIEKGLQEKYMKLIEKTQQDYLTDIFNWNSKVRIKFWSIKSFKAFKWEDKFADADIHITVDVTLKNFGKQLEPPEISNIIKE